MLVDAHNTAIDHQVLKIWVICYRIKNLGPVTLMRPTVIAYVYSVPVTKTFR